jgi:hypothetical protein
MYKTINGWTKDKMKAQIRLKNNGKRSLSGELDGCAYQAEDGNRCAAGCFIPDGHIALHFGDFIDLAIQIHPELKTSMPLDTEDMYKFQIAHDTANDKEDVRDVLCRWIDENVEDSV